MGQLTLGRRQTAKRQSAMLFARDRGAGHCAALCVPRSGAMPKQEQITGHFCIQGWPGVAKWAAFRCATSSILSCDWRPRLVVRLLFVCRRRRWRHLLWRPQHAQHAPSVDPPRLRDERVGAAVDPRCIIALRWENELSFKMGYSPHRDVNPRGKGSCRAADGGVLEVMVSLGVT